MTGLASSYYWITRIYIPEHLDSDENSKLLLQWELEDSFQPEDNDIITEQQFLKFLQVNESLSVEIQKLQKQFEDNSWSIAFEVIKIQPEWAGKKYLALKKSRLKICASMVGNWLLFRKIQSHR